MTVNAGQIAMWNGPAGERRARHHRQIDAQARLHYERLLAAAAIGPGEHVLDIGCGTGQSTRDAGRAAAAGSALGVDLSAPMLAVARRLSLAEGLGNVSFEQADAQVHRFAPERFDIAISRFGVMFFADPAAAFSNVARALRPAARLALAVWQARERNEWALAIRQALTGREDMPELPATGHPFTLADPAAVRAVLGAAGFAGVSLAEVDQPVLYGADVAAAVDLVRSQPTTIEILAELDAAGTARALDRLRAVLAAHDTGQGIVFRARSWVITARRG